MVTDAARPSAMVMHDFPAGLPRNSVAVDRKVSAVNSFTPPMETSASSNATHGDPYTQLSGTLKNRSQSIQKVILGEGFRSSDVTTASSN
jgi:hypothetical protein